MNKKTSSRKTEEEVAGGGDELVDLRLYVANATPRCLTAYENIRRICEEYVAGRYRITVIDLLKCPGLARSEEITAIPTLIRVPRSPGHRKIIGMLTDTQKVLDELDLVRSREYHRQGTVWQRGPAH